MTPTDTSQTKWTCNPGSLLAQKNGCTCAVMDNNHGKFAPWPPDGWWITAGCPMHTTNEEDVEQEAAFAEQEL